ncbi:hypothetical protein GLOTRDRAFT_117455 [Gloeophyllum trabeum ATCC 11539]|uniref:Uncharacterized protein n=1 Tax=Gloeophyllum trabeum (strain ATCC 11539 / FP-39264 / Madison 617) TaxID=670483 RepID=S7PYK3_GLOTA|nr:uncharacterized protein GLOTRDRAFT_117455 [Gloeophyllum trabeum ATCC 11539]EPQ52731.1 hypothetical protein GLOTRDRAFT_117455 [Gloeophyllum trabeum ATCC 11539]
MFIGQSSQSRVYPGLFPGDVTSGLRVGVACLPNSTDRLVNAIKSSLWDYSSIRRVNCVQPATLIPCNVPYAIFLSAWA